MLGFTVARHPSTQVFRPRWLILSLVNDADLYTADDNAGPVLPTRENEKWRKKEAFYFYKEKIKKKNTFRRRKREERRITRAAPHNHIHPSMTHVCADLYDVTSSIIQGYIMAAGCIAHSQLARGSPSILRGLVLEPEPRMVTTDDCQPWTLTLTDWRINHDRAGQNSFPAL